jgi:hypothetical protein
VLLLRCLTVIHGFLPSLGQGALFTLASCDVGAPQVHWHDLGLHAGGVWEARTPVATDLLAQFKHSVLLHTSAAIVLGTHFLYTLLFGGGHPSHRASMRETGGVGVFSSRLTDGKQIEGLVFLGVVAKQLEDGVWPFLSNFQQVHATAGRTQPFNPISRPPYVTSRVCPPLSCGTERTTPACCACLAMRRAKCGSRLSNSYSRPAKPSWRPTAMRCTARYPPAALHSWGPCRHVTVSTHHQIWWMCIGDCDAQVRAVACRRLHAAYVHDAAIKLRWKLPAIVLRLDQVGSLVLTPMQIGWCCGYLTLATWCRPPLTGNRSLGTYVAPLAAGQLCAPCGF